MCLLFLLTSPFHGCRGGTCACNHRSLARPFLWKTHPTDERPHCLRRPPSPFPSPPPRSRPTNMPRGRRGSEKELCTKMEEIGDPRRLMRALISLAQGYGIYPECSYEIQTNACLLVCCMYIRFYILITYITYICYDF